MSNWYQRPLDRRAPVGGEVGVNDRTYKAGQFMPFYVPRPVMPQIDELDYPAFFDFLETRGINVDRRMFDPGILCAHQRVDLIHAELMPPAVRCKPILISRDLFVLDGNHRWKLHMLNRTSVPAYVLDADFEAAIEAMFAFPKTYDLEVAAERN